MYVPQDYLPIFSNWFIDYTFLDHSERGSRSMQQGRFTTSQVATVDASAISCYFKYRRSSPLGSHTWFTLL